MKILRKSKGWTQDEMQEQCGIQRATWSNYENGYTEPNIETLIKISSAFEVTIDDLILRNFADVQLIKENDATKKTKNVQVNVQPTVQLKGQNKPYGSPEDRPETTANEPDEVGTWAILGQLKRIEEKIDQLRDTGENSAKK